MHVGSSSPTRDQTGAPFIGSMESYPLDHEGSPEKSHLNCRKRLEKCIFWYRIRVSMEAKNERKQFRAKTLKFAVKEELSSTLHTLLHF